MIACLQGGLGNQMFQYAMARAISIRLQSTLHLNTNRFQHCILGRRYSLGLWKGINQEVKNIESNIIREKGLPYNPNLLSTIKPDSTIIGYWQTEKYFIDIADLLRSEFVPRHRMSEHGLETLAQIKEYKDRSTFLTIRRTDYLNNDFHGILTMDYYKSALKLISKHTEPMVFVFSDDADWCRHNLQLPYPFIVAGNYDMTTKNHLGREDEELTLMSSCKHAVLANSSYSWWGAWLNPNPGTIVAPKRWFVSTEEDPRDIVPERWLRC